MAPYLGGVFVVVRVVRIPEELDQQLQQASKSLSMEFDKVMVFALVRFLEVLGLMFEYWR